MSDETEWAQWARAWRGASGPLPALRVTAEREARRHRWATASFWLACALGLALAGVVFSMSQTEPSVRVIAWVIVGFFSAMAGGYGWARNGAGDLRNGVHPQAALDFMERRLRLEARTAQVVRWGYVALFSAFTLVFPGVVAHHERPQLELGISFSAVAIMLGLTFAAPWWVARRNRPQFEQLHAWRQWLQSEELEAEQLSRL